MPTTNANAAKSAAIYFEAIEMRMLTLWQPWASLIALGLKQYETRDWKTFYRGKLVIHAAKRPIDQAGRELIADLRFMQGQEMRISGDESAYPLGCVVAIADLTDCQRMFDTYFFGSTKLPPSQIAIDSISDLEEAVGYWAHGRYALKLENVIALPEPIPAIGRQGLINVSNKLRQELKEAIAMKKEL